MCGAEDCDPRASSAERRSYKRKIVRAKGTKDNVSDEIPISEQIPLTIRADQASGITNRSEALERRYKAGLRIAKRRK